MASVHEIVQGIVSISVTIGTFILIGTESLPVEQGLTLIFALLGGLGLGYANGRKSNAK